MLSQLIRKRPKEEIKTQASDEALYLERILIDNIDHSEINPKTKDQTAEYVSNRLKRVFPLLSPEIYNLKRSITIVPANADHIMQSFDRAMYARGIFNEANKLDLGEPSIDTKIPLIVVSKYDDPKSIPLRVEGNVEFDVSLRLNRVKEQLQIEVGERESLHNDKYKKEGGIIRLNSSVNGHLDCSINMRWVYGGRINECYAKSPDIPEEVRAELNESMIRYFTELGCAQKEGFRPLPMPEMYIAWIPKVGDIIASSSSDAVYAPNSLEIVEPKPVKIIRPQRVDPDPALILRLEGKDRNYDHVLSLWDSERDELRSIRPLIEEFKL
ncbi:hypothetical protein H6503_04265 [Candidatus Woesearchaeota archaeon]|nr:hypothetical protein [Candidatus Woesearchaeota archaeon]